MKMTTTAWDPPDVQSAAQFDDADVAEIYCDAGVITTTLINVETVCFRIYKTTGGTILRPVVRLVTPAIGFDWSLATARQRRLLRL